MGDLSVFQTIIMATGLVITVLGAIYGLYAFVAHNAYKKGVKDTNLATLERKVDSLPCRVDENYANKRDQAYAKIAETSNSIDIINDSLTIIKNWVIKQDPSMIDPLTLIPSIEKYSPKELNDLGYKIIEIIDGTAFLENHQDYLLSLIDKESPKTALDVETRAYFVILMATDNDIFNPIKDIIYNAPAIKTKTTDGKDVDFIISLSNMAYVLSIPLRTMYLEKHPELLSSTKDS